MQLRENRRGVKWVMIRVLEAAAGRTGRAAGRQPCTADDIWRILRSFDQPFPCALCTHASSKLDKTRSKPILRSIER